MTPAFSADDVQPVRMGCGLMTFDTVSRLGFRRGWKVRFGADSWWSCYRQRRQYLHECQYGGVCLLTRWETDSEIRW